MQHKGSQHHKPNKTLKRTSKFLPKKHIWHFSSKMWWGKRPAKFKLLKNISSGTTQLGCTHTKSNAATKSDCLLFIFSGAAGNDFRHRLVQRLTLKPAHPFVRCSLCHAAGASLDLGLYEMGFYVLVWMCVNIRQNNPLLLVDHGCLFYAQDRIRCYRRVDPT